MTHNELAIYWTSVTLQLLLCVIVYARQVHRRLPFFAAYVTALAAGSLALLYVYCHFGFRSATSYYAAWIRDTFDLIARSLAIVELCRYELQAYRGIWAMAWRVLAVLGAIFVGHAAMDAWGQTNCVAIYGLTIERDMGISSVVVLLAMLLIRDYYGISLDPLQKWVAVGICFYCSVDIVNNTILRDAFATKLFFWFVAQYSSFSPEMRAQVERAQDMWNGIRAGTFMISMSLWCFALRKPLPARRETPVLLPAEVYGKLSPMVNTRLRAFNDRLLEVLRP